MSEDRYDEIERRSREHEAAARAYRRILFGGDPEGATTSSPPADHVGRTASADAGERAPEVPPREASSIEKFRDFILYGPDREPDDAS